MNHVALRPRRLVTLSALIAITAPAWVIGSLSGAAAAPDKTLTASNATSMSLPDYGNADPFPSSIVVPAHGGVVSDVDVTLVGLDHTSISDLRVVLVGPTGIRSSLLYARGNYLANPAPVTLTLDDEALASVPATPTISSGTYQPSDQRVISNPGQFPADLASSLSAFDGTAASGTWSLFVDDRFPDDSGVLAGGWSLDIDYNDTVAPGGTLSVGGGATLTGTPTTTLTLSATDPDPGTGVAQMRFSNDGSTWSPFQAYAPTASWSLSPGDGPKTVYAQYADTFGNLSAPVSDTIGLDTPAPRPTKLSPRKNATGVPTRTAVTFVASKALDPATVTRRTVRLTGNGMTVHAKVSYAPDTRRLTLAPQKALPARQSFKVKISDSVTDLAGNAFVTPTWSFRTR